MRNLLAQVQGTATRTKPDGFGCIIPPSPYYYVEITSIINWGSLAILAIGLILIFLFIYFKNKGEKGIWKRILKGCLVYTLIILLIRIVLTLLSERNPDSLIKIIKLFINKKTILL